MLVRLSMKVFILELLVRDLTFQHWQREGTICIPPARASVLSYENNMQFSELIYFGHICD